jgi:hypothetical protein
MTRCIVESSITETLRSLTFGMSSIELIIGFRLGETMNETSTLLYAVTTTKEARHQVPAASRIVNFLLEQNPPTLRHYLINIKFECFQNLNLICHGKRKHWRRSQPLLELWQSLRHFPLSVGHLSVNAIF